MFKNNKWKLIFSSVIILLPIIIGIAYWNELPELMPVHWGATGPDRWVGKAAAVFGTPFVMLAVHWFALWYTSKDPKNKGQSEKVTGLLFWLCPIVSIAANGASYFVSLEYELELHKLIIPVLGVVFALLGNYLPKCRQNSTVGFKLKWTLENEENWNATHRFGGKVWAVGGIILIVAGFLPIESMVAVMIAAILALGIIPILYSYFYHKKQVKAGTAVIKPIPKRNETKIVVILSLVVTAGILVFACFVSLTGTVDISYGDDSFTLEASYWSELTLEYDSIESIEYRDSDDAGSRTNGVGNAKILAGVFRNIEFGKYTRYSYANCDACVVLKVDGEIIVISSQNAESTKLIYETIKSNME